MKKKKNKKVKVLILVCCTVFTTVLAPNINVKKISRDGIINQYNERALSETLLTLSQKKARLQAAANAKIVEVDLDDGYYSQIMLDTKEIYDKRLLGWI